MTSLPLTVESTTAISGAVREIVLVRSDGGVLPGHPAGSHLVLDCGGRNNAYSLTNDGTNPERYSIAVLLRPDGAGGSRYVHGLRRGDQVTASGPRSAFPPVLTARRHLLIAGGIGITPMLAHVRDALRWDREVELLYVHRPESATYAAAVDELLGERCCRTTDRNEFDVLLRRALCTAPLGTHLYACGPSTLLDAVAEVATELGWPPGRLHVERFTAELDPGREFTLRLARSDRAVVVAPGVSALEALESIGVRVPNMCRQGVCGECRVPVLAGTPLHRDEYLDEGERSAGSAVMCCVSRSESDILEVDL